MKSTGVVRRVDDLGRIVIPKEIRRNLKIRDGEDLEFFIENDMVGLKKFSKVADLASVSKKLLDVVSTLVGKTILITDRDKFITGSGELKKRYMNKEVSHSLEKIMVNCETIVKKEVGSIELVEGAEDNYSYIIDPIICFGDLIGTVIMISSSSDVAEFDVTINAMIAHFLGKYVED